MPNYQYDCFDCGARTEALRLISQRDDTFLCPECKGANTKRRTSAPTVHTPLDGNFRGSGHKDLDRTIGRDAEKRRAQYQAEQEKRNAVRRASGQRAVGRRADGSYAPMTQQQLDQRQAGFDKFDYAKRTGTRIDH